MCYQVYVIRINFFFIFISVRPSLLSALFFLALLKEQLLDSTILFHLYDYIRILLTAPLKVVILLFLLLHFLFSFLFVFLLVLLLVFVVFITFFVVRVIVFATLAGRVLGTIGAFLLEFGC